VKTTDVLDERASALLREAQDWRLLGLLFERPRGDWWQEIAELAETTGDENLRAAARATPGAGQGGYLALLGPGGVLSAREAGYRKTTDPSQMLFEIRAAYEAFAYAPLAEDPPDHLAVECGFVGWLCLKQAYALAGGDADAASIAADAAAAFQKRHLAAMAEPLVVRLELLEPGYLLLAAKALLARVGERPKDLEGYWVPDGLAGAGCASACGAWAGGDEQPGDEPAELPLDVAQALES
jgi:hypothetical protein